MFPIVLDLALLRVGLVGHGRAAQQRLRLLDEDGARHVQVFCENGDPELAEKAGGRLIRRLPTRDEIAGFNVLFLAGLSDAQSRALAEQAREEGVLVNTEDVRGLCDFHMPASVRRGDLLLSVSTGGGLAWPCTPVEIDLVRSVRTRMERAGRRNQFSATAMARSGNGPADRF